MYDERLTNSADPSAMPHIAVVLGTRPEGVKLAPIVLEAERRGARVSLISTGQHETMLAPIFELFDITPTVDLGLLGLSLHELTARAMLGISTVLEELHPDVVLVQGDTTSAFAGALAAFYQKIPVVHVEAGLRTYNLDHPFPEEANRRMISEIAALHLAPTPSTAENLRLEGIPAATIVVTGNTVIDALALALEHNTTSPLLDTLALDPRRKVLCTTHRRESWGEPMEQVAKALAELATDEDLVFVVPQHKNPLVRTALAPLAEFDNVMLTEPVDYPEFCQLLALSDLILTDSGGVQEEAPSLNKPVLVLRDTTERPEAVSAGVAQLVGTNHDTIVEAARHVLNNDEAYTAMAKGASPYGDGAASARTIDAVLHLLGRGPRAQEFIPKGDLCITAM